MVSVAEYLHTGQVIVDRNSMTTSNTMDTIADYTTWSRYRCNSVHSTDQVPPGSENLALVRFDDRP